MSRRTMAPHARRIRLHLTACGILLPILLACAKAPPAAAHDEAAREASPRERLARDIGTAIHLPGVQRATWGIAVESLDRHERLFDLNAGALLVPASVAKLVTVASAADAVGWDYRFETTIRTSGTLDAGTLHGDLVIVGSGDPSIGGRGGDDLSRWIDALKSIGIARITGRIIGDDNAIDEPRPGFGWAWDDLGYRTGAIFGALNVLENAVAVTVWPGATAGSPTTIATPGLSSLRPLANRSVTGAAGSLRQLWPEQRPGEPFLTIAGSVPVGSGPSTLAVSAGNPTLWFASVLRHRLIDAGIDVTGAAVDGDDVEAGVDSSALPVLYTYRSPPLREIVRPLLKESINLYAEAVMRLNVASGVFPTNDAALAGLKTRLAAWGIPADGQQLVDGSGLSRRDVVAGDTVLAVLERNATTDLSAPWMDALPIAGIDGSLRNRMKGTPAEGNVRAKTGTMSNIRSLAGYVTTQDGERLAFVVLVNNFEGEGATVTRIVDSIAIRLAEFTRK